MTYKTYSITIQELEPDLFDDKDSIKLTVYHEVDENVSNFCCYNQETGKVSGDIQLIILDAIRSRKEAHNVITRDAK